MEKQSFSEWLDKTTKRAITRVEVSNLSVQKKARGNHRQDLSRPILENLLGNGYTDVEWDSGDSTHAPCIELNHQKWTLEEFLSGLQHDAPIFEKSHPGDKNCKVIVTGQNLPPVVVDSFGDEVRGPDYVPSDEKELSEEDLTPTESDPELDKILQELNDTDEDVGLHPSELKQIDKYIKDVEKSRPNPEERKPFWTRLWDFLTQKH